MVKKIYYKTKSYHFLGILLFAIILGSFTGYIAGPQALKLKPLGDIFLNLMFTVVIPLVFFSVTSAICNVPGGLKRVWKILSNMGITFLFTGLFAAIFMLIIVKLFPQGQGLIIPSMTAPHIDPINFSNELVNIFTVSDFGKLFSRDNMLALIFFSLLVGLATASLGEKGKAFAEFLKSGSEIFMKLISYIMYYAPIGFFAYFAVLVAQLGPSLLTTYLDVAITYYVAAIIYFIVFLSFYAYLADKKNGLRLFWKNVFLPGTTALATCSSAASIPANLIATKKIGVPNTVAEIVVPLGGILHKDGSTLGGIIKIAFLFGIFHMSFASPAVLLFALLIGVLVGTVMGAIPSGGMIGEVLILSVFGFPPQALIIIAVISMIIDPPATVLNVTSNTVCSMLTARLTEGRRWWNEASDPESFSAANLPA